MSRTNQAAWLQSSKSKSLEVGKASYTPPGPGEIVVKNRALAINPVDWTKRDAGNFVFGWIKYPFIMGSDTAGEVVEVGPNVTRFAVGDRIVGFAVAADRRSNKASEGAFQQYTVLRETVTSAIPDELSYEEACVIPLGLSTAACGLFGDDFLELEPPTLEPKPTGKTVLIWGGASSVGCNAVQLARAAGYEVVTTASPKNHAMLRTFGASEVFDYRSPSVVKDIIEYLQGRTVAGALAIGDTSYDSCIAILGKCKGRKFIAQATISLPEGGVPTNVMGMPSFLASMAVSSTTSFVEAKKNGVANKFIWGSDPAWNKLGPMLYRDFLPQALAEKKFVPAPPPLVVGTGLEFVQQGLELSKKGVSAQKVVVKLDA